MTSAVGAAVVVAVSSADPRGTDLKAEDTEEEEAVRMEEVVDAEGNTLVGAGEAADTTAATRVVEAATDGAEAGASDSIYIYIYIYIYSILKYQQAAPLESAGLPL